MTLRHAAALALALAVCGCARTVAAEQPQPQSSTVADARPDRVGRGNLRTICGMGVVEACDILKNPYIVAKFTTPELKRKCLGGDIAACHELMKPPNPNNPMGQIGTLKP
jgi:hypothetical protein